MNSRMSFRAAAVAEGMARLHEAGQVGMEVVVLEELDQHAPRAAVVGLADADRGRRASLYVRVPAASSASTPFHGERQRGDAALVRTER